MIIFACYLCSSIFYSCTLHQYTINHNNVELIKNRPLSNRISIEVVRNELELTGSRHDEFRSYNSEKLESYLYQGCCFSMDKNSNYVIKYDANVTNELLYPLTVFLFLGTAGIFPVLEETVATITVSFEDKNGKPIKELHYTIQDNFVTSWLSIPLSFFFLSDSYALAMFYDTDHPQKLVANQIESDLYVNLASGNFVSTQEKNNSTLLTNNGQRIAILPIVYKSAKYEVLAESMRNKLETLMVSKRHTVVERLMIQHIIEELKLNQSGLTENNTIKLGQMLNASHIIVGEIFDVNANDQMIEFSVKSIEIESGKIVWKYDYEMDETDIVKASKKTLSDLEGKLR